MTAAKTVVAAKASTRPSAGAPGEGRRAIVVVLGMHRSMTSLSTRVLSLLGGTLPQDLMPPTPENERGYFESESLVHAHDTYLESLGSRWDSLRPIPQVMEAATPAAKEDLTRALRSFLGKVTKGTEVPIVKDPRLCLLLPTFAEVATEFDLEVVCILIHRHPREVAASLTSRNGFVLGKGLFLWLRHVLQAELDSRPFRRASIGGEEILKDWESAMNQLRDQLGMGWPGVATPKARSEIKAFLAPELHHERVSSLEADQTSLPEVVLRTYDLLRKGRIDTLPIQKQFDAIRKEVAQIDALAWPIIDAADQALATHEKTHLTVVEAMNQEAVAMQQETAAMKQEAADLSVVAQQSQSDIRSLQSELDRTQGQTVLLKRSLDESQTVLHGVVEEIGRLRGETAAILDHQAEAKVDWETRVNSARQDARKVESDLQTVLGELDAARLHLQKERATIHAIEQSASWKVTSPLPSIRKPVTRRQRSDDK